MSEEIVIRGKRGAFNNYAAFLEKFKAAKTTDDCYTPQPIYDLVLDYVFEKGALPDNTEIIRPFYPGGNYREEYYPEGCVVVDNPPFSILSQIVRFYVGRGIKFFLFAPSLTLFSSSSSSSCTKIVCGCGITYANKAQVATSFLTNIWGENAIIVDGELTKRIEEVDNATKPKNEKRGIIYPDNVVSAALLQKIAKRGVTIVFPSSEIRPIKSAGGVSIFGGGYMLSSKAAAERAAAERAAAERAAAERAAAERAAAERAAAERVKFLPKDLAIIDELDGNRKPFYEQTLF